MRVEIDVNKIIENQRKSLKDDLKKFAWIIKEKVDEKTPEDTKELLGNNLIWPLEQVGTQIGIRVFNETEYAPYVEFGTIELVEVPNELTEYAMQFKGKGIIKKGGMKARPYLYPALVAERPKFIAAIKSIMTHKETWKHRTARSESTYKLWQLAHRYWIGLAKNKHIHMFTFRTSQLLTLQQPTRIFGIVK